MTAARLAFRAALVSILSIVVCNAQMAPPETTFGVVTLHYETTEAGAAVCFLENPLSQEKIQQAGYGQLRCNFQPELQGIIVCYYSGYSCQGVKSICDSLNGRLGGSSRACEELNSPSEN